MPARRRADLRRQSINGSRNREHPPRARSRHAHYMSQPKAPLPHTDRADLIRSAADEFAVATANSARPELYGPLTFLLAQIRQALALTSFSCPASSTASVCSKWSAPRATLLPRSCQAMPIHCWTHIASASSTAGCPQSLPTPVPRQRATSCFGVPGGARRGMRTIPARWLPSSPPIAALVVVECVRPGRGRSFSACGSRHGRA